MLRHTRPAAIFAGLLAPLALLAAPHVGSAAPDFTAKDVSGKTVKLADYKGKVVVLEWFNPNCPFVKKFYGSSKMQELQKDAASKGVVWLTVYSTAPKHAEDYYDDAALTKKVAELKALPSDVLADPSGALVRLYDAKTTPQLFIIGVDGKLAYDGAIDSVRSPDAGDIAKAKPLFADALGAVLAGKPVADAKNKSYGCGIKL